MHFAKIERCSDEESRRVPVDSVAQRQQTGVDERFLRRGLFSMLVFAGLTAATPASALTFNVDNFGDFADANPGDGVCANTGGFCTLRAAVMEGNALSGPHVVNLPAGTYTLLGNRFAGFVMDCIVFENFGKYRPVFFKRRWEFYKIAGYGCTG